MLAPSSGTITLEVVLRFVDVATDALADAREEIDALNVFPVPDGDTGTNLYLTVSAARDAIREAAQVDVDLRTALAALGRGALLGARGNSGVILSQMLGAIAHRISRATPEERNAVILAEALGEATDASYAAVGEPVEGTILTVARAAADAAARVAGPQARVREVFTAAAAAAREALARTPEQLAALRDAGVVDAGGRGLSVILDAAETVLTGRRPPVAPSSFGSHRIPVPVPTDDLTEDGPAYEVMYLLDAEDDRIPPLRSALAPLGDSLVVVGGDGLWNVHVHVDDVGAAIEAGINAGRPHRVQVTHFAEQVAGARQRTAERTGRRIVAVAAGEGLASLFAGAGAEVVIGGPGHRPSTRDVLDAILATGAGEVVILPNDPDSVRVAEIAARTAESDEGIRVVVVPTVAQVQGLAALAVHEPGRAFDQDVLEMTATARHARHGAVTVAAKRAMTMAGPCEPGDVLGVVEGDFAVIGDDLYAVATAVLDRLLGGGGELVTIVRGKECAVDLAGRCTAYVEEHHAHVDVLVYDGGQDRYPLLVGVE
ncbi:DAK2 domain-containing protein [Nocardioides sp.]|uniref:DAK2 domain-containing protein n=1 Tax=Nocardioides sp. TaxID=35761 RepID=UPI002ED03FD3